MIFEKVIEYANAHNLIPDKSKIVIGLSGGPDSVFLLYFLKWLALLRGLELIAAHVDHEWRPDSHKDAEFCKKICEKLAIPLHTRKASELEIELKFNGSQEEMGRIVRRSFFQELLKKERADLIALGQHEQDQQETFFIRLIRGTTLSGLIGMRPKSGPYIRPLLETSKKEIVDYLNKNKIDYAIDPTNIAESFLRNRIRMKVLPALQKCDKRFDQNFLRTLHSLQETEKFLENLTKKAFEEISEKKGEKIYLNIHQLYELDPYLQNRLLIYLFIKENVTFTPTESLLKEVRRFLENKKSNKHQLYKNWTLVKKKGFLYITQQ